MFCQVFFCWGADIHLGIQVLTILLRNKRGYLQSSRQGKTLILQGKWMKLTAKLKLPPQPPEVFPPQNMKFGSRLQSSQWLT